MCQRLAGMDDRLHRWACWASARGTLHSAGVSSIYRAAEYVIGSDWDRSVSWSPRVNFDELEAQATDRAVLALAPAQRTVLIIVYVKCLGSTKEVQARHARLSSSRCVPMITSHPTRD